MGQIIYTLTTYIPLCYRYCIYVFNCYSKAIKDAWDHKKSSFRNLRDMGLATDPNKTIKIPNFKKEQVIKAKQIVNEDSDLEEEVVVRVPRKGHVVEILEKECKAPRERKLM